MSLLDECLAAHGGRDAFERLGALDLRLACSGIALASKLRPRAVRGIDARVDLHAGVVELRGLGGWSRGDARPPAMPWRVRWDDRELSHFIGYALWNYVAAPFMWERECEVRELPNGRLALSFRDAAMTHSRDQVVHLDDRGRIARLDYTADVFGRWARAENRCLAYESWDGVVIPVRRRVTPRRLGHPTLIAIDIERQPAASSAGAVR